MMPTCTWLWLTLQGLDHSLLLAGFAHSWLFPEQRSRVGLEHWLLFAAGFVSRQATEQSGLVLQLLLLLFQLLQKHERQIKNGLRGKQTAHGSHLCRMKPFLYRKTRRLFLIPGSLCDIEPYYSACWAHFCPGNSSVFPKLIVCPSLTALRGWETQTRRG